MKTIHHLLGLLACLLMLSAVAVRRSGRLWGYAAEQKTGQSSQVALNFLERQSDGSIVIDTTVLGAHINGYAGPTPLRIHFKDGVVQLIEALPNQDTPEFFSATEEAGFREQWYGKSAQEAIGVAIEPISGATYSSTAFIQNVQAGLTAYLASQGEEAASPAPATSAATWRPSLKFFAGLLVALCAAILPFFVKHKHYRVVQLLLNVLVLGFWCGAFVSHTLLVKYLSQGIGGLEALLPLVLLAMAFVYPLFGRKSHYCMQACPFGSLQELAGKCTKRKLRLSQKCVKGLDAFRQVLWAALLFVMWCGAFFTWMDAEPFSAFLVKTAPPAALALAALFLVLSFFVPRPYCRFVCPTGTLLKFAESDC